MRVHQSLRCGQRRDWRVSCNGWRFWSVETVPPVAAIAAKPAPRQRKPKVAGQLKRIANQHGIPAGHVRWFCSACQKGFLVEGDGVPEACPLGHPRLPVETTTDSAAAEATTLTDADR